EIVMNALKFSDFVCVVTRASVRWPFDRQMAELLPRMDEWCEGHLTYVGSMDTARFSVSVYERPAIGVQTDGVKLASMVSAASRRPGFERPEPPAVPRFT